MIAVRFVLAGALLTAVTCVSAPTPTARQESNSPAVTTSPEAPPTSSAPAADADVSHFVRVLVPSWRPAGPTVVVDRRPGVGKGHVIVAVPLSGAPAIDLVAFSSDSPTWDIRSDGSAVVAAVNSYCADGVCDTHPKRLAVVDLQVGRARWLTPADESRTLGPPLWAPDGAFVYYGAANGGVQGVDLGIHRIGADGAAPIRITDPVPPAAASFGQTYSSAQPQRVTPDGLLFWYAVSGEQATLKVRDLASGPDRAFVTNGQCVAIVAWRTAAPGALVRHGGCQTPSSSLALWDVRTGAQTMLVDRPAIAYGADWDPTATRIVAAVGDISSNATELAIINVRDRNPIVGTRGALSVRWLSVGIAYTTIANTAATSSPDCVFGISDVRFLPTAGGPPNTLYSGCGISGVLLAVNP